MKFLARGRYSKVYGNRFPLCKAQFSLDPTKWISDRRSTKKKENSRPCNTSVIWGVCLILTRYWRSYLYGVCNRNLYLIYGIVENHIIHLCWTWFLHVHVGRLKMSMFVGLFAIINKYPATMNPDIHCSHKILKTLGILFERWGRCLFSFWIIFF